MSDKDLSVWEAHADALAEILKCHPEKLREAVLVYLGEGFEFYLDNKDQPDEAA